MTTQHDERAGQVPLYEQLASVPKEARLVIDQGPHSTRFIPVGRMCHEAAALLAADAQAGGEAVKRSATRPSCSEGGCPNKAECDAAQSCLYTHPQPQTVAQEIEQLIRERDYRDEIIDRLCDAVLGEDLHEWSSAYGFEDAVADVEERINQLHQPSVDRAWARFEQAHSQQAAQVAQPLTEYHCIGFVDGYDTQIKDKSAKMKAPRAVYVAAHGIGKDRG